MDITDGSTAQHLFLVELVSALRLSASGPWNVNGGLALFWQRVEAAGSPLLTEGEDGVVTATFLWRDQPERQDVDTVFVSMQNWVEPLALLAGTDVWFVELRLPLGYASGYCLQLGTDGVIFNEDVHEPWAMSFGDSLNPWPIRAEDSIYPRNIVRASGLSRPGQLRGEVHRIRIPALLLNGPRQAPTFPVSVYEPPRSVTSSDAALPVVIFLNGQFLESSDALPLLDQAMEDGSLSPALLVFPGSLRGVDDHTAWGWRNAYGPHNLSDHFTQELFPALEAAHDLSGGVHLVAWDYAAHAAVRTAMTCARVVSVTLLNPSGVSDAPAVGRSRTAPRPVSLLNGIDLIADDLISLMQSTCFVQLSEIAPRDGQPSTEDSSDLLAGIAAVETGRKLDRTPLLSDPDLVAGASALLPALARVFGER